MLFSLRQLRTIWVLQLTYLSGVWQSSMVHRQLHYCHSNSHATSTALVLCLAIHIQLYQEFYLNCRSLGRELWRYHMQCSLNFTLIQFQCLVLYFLSVIRVFGICYKPQLFKIWFDQFCTYTTNANHYLISVWNFVIILLQNFIISHLPFNFIYFIRICTTVY